MPHAHNGVGVGKLSHHQLEMTQRYMRSNNAFESGRAEERRVLGPPLGRRAAQRER
jgi:hypothetical protein